MKRGNKGNVSNGKSSSNVSSLIVKKDYLNGTLKAKREVVKGKDIELKTEIHYLNPRNQEALTLEAVSDIYSSIKENGVSTEGVAIERDGKYRILDASRRRFCCIESVQDLPLWVIEGDPTDAQLLRIINDSQEVKKWSYPEHGHYLLKIANIKGLDVKLMKIDELSNELGIGRESLRKRLESLDIDISLRTVFVDYEGIPNSYYSELAKLQRSLLKANFDVANEVEKFKAKLSGNLIEGSLSERQKKTLDMLKDFVNDLTKGSKHAAQWTICELGHFDNKRAGVKRKVNESTRKTVYEFTRLPKDLQAEIDALIEAKLP
ncbi:MULTISPECIES: ParB family protein [Vibrio harveyi group]|jgi:ParB family chromosome partitioning protein|uniref:ParB family protein n=1 Tax=Vibrio harveyi group TaxID=717610 RepID=UPI000CF4C9EF|nr:ParB family protein [Vibrio jasicida]PQJ44306.1 hypothetical protein BTO01_29290 [Vibrio jasicida]